MNLKFITGLSLVLLLSSCRHAEERQLGMALHLAGENRGELEKVLAHYSQDERDSLKLKAAKFLIRNMPGHRSYTGEAIERYYAEAAPILLSNRKRSEKESLMNKLFEKYPEERIQTEEDVRIMRADFLIKNIDTAFHDWQEEPWAKDLSFDDFCEYLLPYKCTDLQALDGWRDSLRFIAHETLKHYPHNYIRSNSSYWAARAINLELGSLMKINIRTSMKNHSLFRVPLWLTVPSATCDTYSLIAVSAFRSQGIPAANDFILHWASGYSDHSWVTFWMESGEKAHCEGSHGTIYGYMRPGETKGKVYRRTYAANPELIKLNRDTKCVPSQFQTWFMKDVTNEYMETTRLSVHPIPQLKQRNQSYAYIAVFGDQEWIPIGFERINTKTITFNQLEKNVVYLPCYYTEEGVEAMDYPLLIDKKKQVRRLMPDTAHTRSITIRRKYPISRQAYDKGLLLQGGSFQAANLPDFSDAVAQYTFSKFSLSGEIIVQDTTTYRYWRYYNPKKTNGNIAEMSFFDRDGNLVKGDIICTEEKEPDNPMRNKLAPFDHNPFSYFNAAQDKEAWIGMDFKRPVSISQIEYMARSDDNNIRIGDWYELCYWGQNEWISLGEQQATKLFLTFTNVPENALLILHNQTRGSNERIFLYENGKQIWY